MNKLKKYTFVLSALMVLLAVTGCFDNEIQKESWHGIDRPESWDEKDFAKICLDGIFYYARTPVQGRAYFAVAIDKETLKAMACDS